jgi:hypothetical protein
MNSVPKTDASAPATIDCHFIEPLSPLNPAPAIVCPCGKTSGRCALSSAARPSPRTIALAARAHAPRTVVTVRGVLGERIVEVVRLVEQLRCLRAAGGCQRTHSIRQIGPWLLTANQSRASTGRAIPGTPACDGTLSNTWQPLQSKVCKVDSSLSLNCIGRPQKGQRGRGASTSMRLVVRS